MESIISSNKNKVLAFARAAARRARITLPTEDDLVEDEGVFYVDLDLPKNSKLPKGIVNKLVKEKDKVAEIAKEKVNAPKIKDNNPSWQKH